MFIVDETAGKLNTSKWRSFLCLTDRAGGDEARGVTDLTTLAETSLWTFTEKWKHTQQIKKKQ